MIVPGTIGKKSKDGVTDLPSCLSRTYGIDNSRKLVAEDHWDFPAMEKCEQPRRNLEICGTDGRSMNSHSNLSTLWFGVGKSTMAKFSMKPYFVKHMARIKRFLRAEY